ncbi:CAP domain-containing protein [Streptomyces virginiae]|uniref:CAP domain-containing protein n=1 Tax=Streptomyces virginiae TaxID=1961 RepID=UPI00333212A8
MRTVGPLNPSHTSTAPSPAPEPAVGNTRPPASSADPRETGAPSALPVPERITDSPTPVPSPTPVKPSANGKPTASITEQLAQQVVALTNTERLKHGCPPVSDDPRLTLAAKWHSDEMAAREYYGHYIPNRPDAGTRITSAGYNWSNWNQIINKGPTHSKTAMEGWIQTAGNRATVLNCSFRHVGVSVNLASTGPWWTAVFAIPAQQ